MINTVDAGNFIGIAKKLGLLLTVVILVSLSLPAHIVLASVATVEVNSGNTIILGIGESVPASDVSGIPVEVKGLPDLDAPANGLAGFTFDFSWDKDVIHVDSAYEADAAGWLMILPGTPDNETGTLTSTGMTATYSTADVILLYLGIHAVGSGGDSTSINVTITSLGDKEANPIAATLVNATVQISLGTLLSIAVTPAAPSIVLGETQQFTATGNYTNNPSFDITNDVTWASDNPGVATIDAAGLATSLVAGTTTITATLDAIDGTTTLTVTETEAEEVVEPPVVEAEPGVTDVSDATDENGVFAEEVAAEFEDDKTELAIDEGTTMVKSLSPKPINWWLIGGIIAGVVVIGVVIWLVLRRRTA